VGRNGEKLLIAAGRICGRKAVAALAVLSTSAEEQMAMAAATGLGNKRSREAVRVLISMLANPDGFVRCEAVGALCTLTHHGEWPGGLGDLPNSSQA
jgi:HEAT repeat protein